MDYKNLDKITSHRGVYYVTPEEASILKEFNMVEWCDNCNTYHVNGSAGHTLADCISFIDVTNAVAELEEDKGKFDFDLGIDVDKSDVSSVSVMEETTLEMFVTSMQGLMQEPNSVSIKCALLFIAAIDAVESAEVSRNDFIEKMKRDNPDGWVEESRRLVSDMYESAGQYITRTEYLNI